MHRPRVCSAGNSQQHAALDARWLRPTAACTACTACPHSACSGRSYPASAVHSVHGQQMACDLVVQDDQQLQMLVAAAGAAAKACGGRLPRHMTAVHSMAQLGTACHGMPQHNPAWHICGQACCAARQSLHSMGGKASAGSCGTTAITAQSSSCMGHVGREGAICLYTQHA
jgi:hypothetical protein